LSSFFGARGGDCHNSPLAPKPKKIDRYYLFKAIIARDLKFKGNFMRKIILLLFCLLPLSCSSYLFFVEDIFRDNITIEKLILEKEKIDNEENPALRQLKMQQLAEKKIKLDNILVKKVVKSTNVDYDFSVLADVKTSKGLVECYIFSKNIKRMATLEKNITRLEVEGRLGRFFSMLDEYYTKVEIIKADFKIKKNHIKGME